MELIKNFIRVGLGLVMLRYYMPSSDQISSFLDAMQVPIEGPNSVLTNIVT